MLKTKFKYILQILTNSKHIKRFNPHPANVENMVSS